MLEGLDRASPINTSSRILLNGTTGEPTTYKRGLRQGDPLSPYLFIVAIDPIQRLVNMATQEGLLSPLSNRAARFRVSLYADDAAIFVNPIRNNINNLFNILKYFGEATGLQVNLFKSSVMPIKCAELNLPEVLENFNGQRCNFP